jgi:hypothetical protein
MKFLDGTLRMTNREAILRLSIDTSDCLAMASLLENNAEVIRAAVVLYFGLGPVADKAERILMRRIANHARSYEHNEDPNEWVVKYATTECDRLRNEATHARSTRD